MFNEESIAALAGMMPESEAVPPERPSGGYKSSGWHPRLNPTQQKIFDETAMYILAYGERATGKSIGGIHKLVRHCYENRNALAIIIIGVKRQAEEGGAWFKLINVVLPEWATGLGYDQGDPDNVLFTDPKTNTAKDVFIWIANRHGGWSRVLLLSMPVDSFVADRVKGMEPSFILVDEAQTLESDTYFSSVVQQLGRRPGVPLQQVVYCCNPAGKKHWLYKRFWELSLKDGEWNPKYARYHVPISENRKNIPDEYWQNVVEAVRGDPVEEARMIRGEWMDRASGEAIFRLWFVPEIHVRGDTFKQLGLKPIAGLPIIIGYDPGPVNFSVSFEQMIPTKEKTLWTVFDELNFVGEYTPYFVVVPKILKRMDFWATEVGRDFKFVHVSDEAAFNQARADGSFDAREIEDRSSGRIRLIPCPKGKDSKPNRVRMTISMLQREELFISALCEGHVEMMLQLESERAKGEYDPMAGFRPQRSPHIHPFDSMSYPPFLHTVSPGRFMLRTDEVSQGQVYSAGES